ncbi:protein kinase family protein [Ascosphaera apis ARSEF 7405]|uniref:Protein kinase family protein n=1 Tax=Ascosphaera apis ARSEF 7405 TaxID=392613 RepID=A0A168D1J1_9EURO|nr:protein kinase family protein [Ascosphaera apis ARSEF 7405]
MSNGYHRLVRDQAYKTMDIYLSRIRKYTSSMADTASPNPTASTTEARITTSNETSWAGWAISSFTNKLTSAQGQIEPTANGGLAPSRGPDTNIKSSSLDSPTATSGMTSPERRFQSPIPKSTGEKTLLSAATSKLSLDDSLNNGEILDAWDDMDNDDWDMDKTAEPNAAGSKKPSIASVPSKPLKATPTITRTTSSAAAYDDGGEPDFAGWLAAQSKTKATKTLPKKTAVKQTRTVSTGTIPKTSSKTQTSASRPTRTDVTSTKTSNVKKDDGGNDDDDDDWGAWD